MRESVSIPSRLRLGVSFIIVLMVISSPIIMLVNPVAAAPSSSSSAADVTTYAPSTISQGGSDFTAQAALLGPATFRSTDLVSSTAIYEIQFITTTTGVIDKIDVTFPAGTGVAFAGIIERVGITGPATITKSGTTVTLDLNTPVNVPAGTFVRLEMVDISNPPNPANYKISVTTKDPSNVPIDGPSLSPAYTIRQVSTGMIANNAVTTPKIADGAVTSGDVAPSFMRSKLLFDGQNNWTPDGITTSFFISDPTINANSHIYASTTTLPGIFCGVSGFFPDFGFDVSCNQAPQDGAQLRYTVIDQPNT